jgi:hypothetical protein
MDASVSSLDATTLAKHISRLVFGPNDFGSKTYAKNQIENVSDQIRAPEIFQSQACFQERTTPESQW